LLEKGGMIFVDWIYCKRRLGEEKTTTPTQAGKDHRRIKQGGWLRKEKVVEALGRSLGQGSETKGKRDQAPGGPGREGGTLCSPIETAL